ncbi:S-layer homology domain-containing protein [uncultured Dysosmobacter sp.]|uniref:S-layer homology domain-containing protein n=1 Tax=uncultured Dysosmobacter sp. TaxID=2591384 RepID=UPI0026227082|nr:S-layer homology domain-containing protein [uncultured Dysosmobacter sp.]
MKKFLSLVLALVMVMSLVTVSAGAKDFTDDSKINYEEAVDVMSALKVIDGYPDGSFAPQGSLTRGAAAKIICNLILGPTTASALRADTAPYKDVPINHTFAGYIAYCAQQGIISGYADGSFRPAATLTNYAFLKMLLGALGYNAEIEGYIGDNWSIQVAKRALNIGLTKGLKGDLNGTDYATREQACLYALNTLKATMVEYDAKITANVNGAQVIVGNSVANDVKWNIASKTDGNIKDDDYVQFAEKYFEKLELEITNGMYGRPSNTWKLKKSEIGTYPSIETTYVYTEGTDSKDVYKDLGKAIVEEYDWEAYVNGVEQKKPVLPVKGSDDEWDYTGEGTVTEIYVDNDTEKVTVVEINHYLGQVTKVKSDDDGEYITVKTLSKGAKELDEKTFYVEGYKEDDYVAFTIDWNDDDDEYVIGEVYEPETVTAEVTRVENDAAKDEVTNAVYGNTYLKADGEKYTYSDGDHADKKNGSAKFVQQDHMVYDLDEPCTRVHPELSKDYVLYLDANGYVLAFELAEEDATRYLYVKDSDEELKDWVAKAVLDDATTAKVDVKSKYNYTKADGKKDTQSIVWCDDDYIKDNKSSIDEQIWKYSASDKGVYTLTKVEQTFLPAKDADGNFKEIITSGTAGDGETYGTKIFNGKAYITANGTTFIVDNKTIFVDIEGGKAYTGYKEVPNVENAQLAVVTKDSNKKNSIAEIVFIIEGDIYDKDSTYFMLTKNTRESLKYDGDYYWEYFNAYTNGEKGSVYVAYDASSTVLEKGVLYKATKVVDEQYITGIEKITEEKVPFETVSAAGIDAFWTEDDEKKPNQYDTDENTIFVLVDVELDKDGDLDKISISDGNINDMKDQDGYTKYVRVVEKDEETAELVYIYSVNVDGGDDGEDPEEKPEYDIHAWAGSTKGNVQIAVLKHTYGEDGNLIKDEWLDVEELNALKIGAKDISMKTAGQTFEPTTEEGYPIALNILDYDAVHKDQDGYNADFAGAGFLKVHFENGSVVIGGYATVAIDGIGTCKLTY